MMVRKRSGFSLCFVGSMFCTESNSFPVVRHTASTGADQQELVAHAVVVAHVVLYLVPHEGALYSNPQALTTENADSRSGEVTHRNRTASFSQRSFTGIPHSSVRLIAG